ncbi:MAG: hypothetical protein H6727_07615 [Myxococcales bacterium]|nr:hypothetical protein [Myxococcales bacterium]
MVVLLTLSGCLPLRTKEQLKGADPTWDLVAASVLSRVQKEPSGRFSVEGVRLGDPRSRVFALWGKPSRERDQRATWGSKDGEPLRSVRWVFPRGISKNVEPIVREIDLFPAFVKLLHPDNRDLLSIKIQDHAFRKKLFATTPITRHTRLAKRFLYIRRGWGVVIFSELLPSQKKIPYVVRLFVMSS